MVKTPCHPHAPWQAEETKKRAALLAVSPICALIPAAVLTLVAVPCCWISVENGGFHGGFCWNSWWILWCFFGNESDLMVGVMGFYGDSMVI